MATGNFKASLSRVLVSEGGFVDHPKDPGGATFQGVTQRTYDAYRRGKGLKLRSVRSMTEGERDEIYRRQYWDAVQGDNLPAGVDYVMFDGCTNSGPKQSIKWLQRALGSAYTGAIDGVIGLATLAALNAVDDVAALIGRICDRRLAFLRALDTWPTFGKGWQGRVQNVRRTGTAMAAGHAGEAAYFAAGANVKASIENARKAPSMAAGDAATGGGAGGLTMAGTLQTLQEQLTPFSAAGGWITNLVVALAVGGTLLAVGGIAWRYYAKRKTAQLADALDAVPA
ncbi:N-acetylmuramidase [Rhizobium leguminosarum]|uniref:N-acetylmuramidase n=1 Tax=Rhizobium ruizarguesonis TaxID=2081791 RepID=A0AAE4YWX5_9HYPH|nr:glycoside hydrolase family 108 protein [Rhizobium ruizarguesonis]NEI52730.1 N-acetylmuramidase [Rhizobium ruizarguesonis]